MLAVIVAGTIGRIGWLRSAIALSALALDCPDMKKRIAAAILWFYVGWAVGSLFAFATGLTPALAPILATTAAAIIAGDPRRIIWTQSARVATRQTRERAGNPV